MGKWVLIMLLKRYEYLCNDEFIIKNKIYYAHVCGFCVCVCGGVIYIHIYIEREFLIEVKIFDNIYELVILFGSMYYARTSIPT